MREKLPYVRRRAIPLAENEVQSRMLQFGFKPCYLEAKWDKLDKDLRGILVNYFTEEFFGTQHDGEGLEPVTVLKNRGLFITGAIGVGKTSVMTLLARSLCKFGEGVALFEYAPEVFSALPERSLEQRLKTATVLCLDDLGQECSDRRSLASFSSIIEERYSSYLPTFITSSVSLSDLRENESYRHLADRFNDKKWMLTLFISGKTRRTNEG